MTWISARIPHRLFPDIVDSPSDAGWKSARDSSRILPGFVWFIGAFIPIPIGHFGGFLRERERERERRPLELNPVHWSAGNGAEQSTDRITVWSMIIHCNSIPTPTTSSTPMIQSIMANGPYGAPVSRYHILPCVHWGPSPLSLPRNVFSLIRDSFSVEQSPRWVSRASWTRNDGIHIYIGQRFDTSNSRRRRNWVLNGVEWGGGVRSRHLWSGRRTSPQHRLPLGAPWI